jgi:uncharacterized protein YjbI with pentapeptide repeats
MGNQEHFSILSQGIDVWNAWKRVKDESLKEAHWYPLSLAGVDLSGAHLPGVNFRGVDLIDADLTGANLSKSNLTDARLQGANLRNANLTGAFLSDAEIWGASREVRDFLGSAAGVVHTPADLTQACLRHAVLSRTKLRGVCFCEADLSDADLRDSDLREADFSGANFHRVRLGDTIFSATNLTNATNLGSCLHEGPSVLDYPTIIGAANLPRQFLRGCGVPEWLINFFASMSNEPVQFYSCFISYSTKDQAFADRLHADLQNGGVRCWFAPHDVKGGRRLHEQIDEAIRLYDRLLLILSEHSMNSEWVNTEIAHARQKELNERRQVLFPISLVQFETIREWRCFDADTGKDSAREIREYFIPDFSNWKDHDSYQRAFQRLVRDLKSEDTAAAP